MTSRRADALDAQFLMAASLCAHTAFVTALAASISYMVVAQHEALCRAQLRQFDAERAAREFRFQCDLFNLRQQSERDQLRAEKVELELIPDEFLVSLSPAGEKPLTECMGLNRNCGFACNRDSTWIPNGQKAKSCLGEFHGR